MTFYISDQLLTDYYAFNKWRGPWISTQQHQATNSRLCMSALVSYKAQPWAPTHHHYWPRTSAYTVARADRQQQHGLRPRSVPSPGAARYRPEECRIPDT